jgi:anti-sigma regulatory factor (Ser/Thr protein kinase)
MSGRKVGGLGIHLLRSLMQSVEYRRAGNRNVLTFRTPAVPPAAA